MGPQQREVARQWFIPGEGIDRHVISTDIQRYLGNDATVRPGAGTGQYDGVQGYWIKAYRNLTSAMIADLRADSQRWRQEQHQTGTQGSYADSNTRDRSRMNPTGGSTQAIDEAYIQSRQGGPMRPPADPMQMDLSGNRMPQDQYGQPAYYSQEDRGQQYGADPNRGFAPQGRGQAPYPPDPNIYGVPDQRGRLPMHPPGQERAPQGYRHPGPPQGYVQEGQYYVPVTSNYVQSNTMAPSGPDQYDYRGGQQPAPQRDPRNAPQPGYGGQGYNNVNPYPNSAPTNADPTFRGVAPQGNYGQPQYDSMGRPISSNQYPQQYQQEPGYAQPLPQSRDPNYGRQQQPDPSRRDGDRRRR